MTMTHPGLPESWGWFIVAFVGVTSLWVLYRPSPVAAGGLTLSLARLPFVGKALQRLVVSRWFLVILRLVTVALFLTIIAAGLFGTPIAERNMATVLTWNLWWAGLIFSVFFLGTAWCAVCPWNALAQWLVRRRLWRRAEPNNSLDLRVPRRLRNIWPALFLFVALSWLELGLGITTSPYATALVALLMVVLATVSLSMFERNAFCRYFCPVGRTVGSYSQLAPIEMRPTDADICARCETLDCYHGNETTEPCPTWLVMGRLKQNSYCTSCGNCAESCPHDNVTWRLRTPGVEALGGGRPHWDEAWFMIGLLALTSLHGITMMPFWEGGMSAVARFIGDSGRLLFSFTLGLAGWLVVIAAVYALLARLTYRLIGTDLSFRRFFAAQAFVALPLAFSYHLAHNLSHLVRETTALTEVSKNPLGIGAQPLSMMEKHQRYADMLLSQETLFAVQALLMVFGFWLAVQITRHRSQRLMPEGATVTGWRLAPLFAFAIGITGFHLWLLMQPMVMRM